MHLYVQTTKTKLIQSNVVKKNHALPQFAVPLIVHNMMTLALTIKQNCFAVLCDMLFSLKLVSQIRNAITFLEIMFCYIL